MIDPLRPVIDAGPINGLPKPAWRRLHDPADVAQALRQAADLLKTLPGYDGDVQQSQAQARTLMEKLGYGPDKHLAVTTSTQPRPLIRR